MLSTSKEKSRSNRSIQENIFLLLGELEDSLKDIDRGRRLLQEELDRRVRHDRFPILTRHEILDILSDRRNPESIFSSSLHESEKKLRTILILHNIPGLIHDEYSSLFTRSDRVPDKIQQHKHRNRTKNLIQISNREDDESFLEIDIGRMREYSCEDSIDIFIESIDEPTSSIHRLED